MADDRPRGAAPDPVLADLPALDGPAPAFLDAAAAKAWLAAQPLAHPDQTRRLLSQEIAALGRHPADAAERVAILDALSKVLNLIQEEAAKRHGDRPLPLAPAESALLTEVVALREACALALIQGLRPMPEPGLAATLLQRALVQLALAARAALHGGRQPGPVHWRRLHGLLALAEARNLAATPVADPGRHGASATSPLAAYGETLLLMAADPFALSARRLAWTARWARRWGGKLALVAAEPSGEARPLAVDLDGDQPFAVSKESPGLRYLDTTALRSSLKQRIALLAQGRSPAQLQLGDDCPPGAAAELLRHLYPRWCKGQTPPPPRGEAAPIRMALDEEAMFHALSGGRRLKEAAPGRPDMAELRRERERIALFDDVAAPSAQAAAEAPPPPLDPGWQGRDLGVADLILQRPAAGSRLKRGRLLALAPSGAPRFALAVVRRLWTEDDGGEEILRAQVHLLPGPVQAEALALAEAGPWRPGYFLPALGDEPANVVLPTGFFAPGRFLLRRGGGSLRLGRLVEKGEEYERVEVETRS